MTDLGVDGRLVTFEKRKEKGYASRRVREAWIELSTSDRLQGAALMKLRFEHNSGSKESSPYFSSYAPTSASQVQPVKQLLRQQKTTLGYL